MKRVSLFLLLFIFLAIPTIYIGYPNTNDKEFMADAPWRVKGTAVTIPIGFFIHDAKKKR